MSECLKKKICILCLPFILPFCRAGSRPERALKQKGPELAKSLGKIGAKLGDPVFIRIFKEEKELEVWVKPGQKFKLFRTYPICKFSGELGPKLREGDGQSPEGFYRVEARQMHPTSRYHLAFNIGFPNEYDRFHKRTGSFLMVHGNCVSVGCYAMTDDTIKEIYTLTDQALLALEAEEKKRKEAQTKKSKPIKPDKDSSDTSVEPEGKHKPEINPIHFQVHIFPFRMTVANMKKHAKNPWFKFWENLKEGYDAFEKSKFPTVTGMDKGIYIFKAEL